MIEEGNQEEIIGLTAHAMGSWKYSSVLDKCTSIWPGPISPFCKFTIELRGLWIRLRRIPKDGCARYLHHIAFAPFMAVWVSVNINYMRRKNDFIADKYAAELGLGLLASSQCKTTLLKKQSAEGNVEVDKMFSMYYHLAPALSERLAALEKLRGERGGKEEGLISLSADEKK